MIYLELKDGNKFKERLRSKYKKNIDYIINRGKQKLMKGMTDARYIISFETFEKICINSTNQKARFLRENYTKICTKLL